MKHYYLNPWEKKSAEDNRIRRNRERRLGIDCSPKVVFKLHSKLPKNYMSIHTFTVELLEKDRPPRIEDYKDLPVQTVFAPFAAPSLYDARPLVVKRKKVVKKSS